MDAANEPKLDRFVFQQKDKYKGEVKITFRVKFQYQDRRHGEIKTAPSGKRFKTRREAEQHLEKLVAEDIIKRGKFKPAKEKLRFADYALTYENYISSRCSPTSHAGEKIRIRTAIEFFGNRTIESITRLDLKEYKQFLADTPVKKEVWAEREAKNLKTRETDIQRYKTIRETKRKSATVHRYLQRLRALLNEAAADDDSLTVPSFKNLIETSLETKRKVTLSFEEFERLLSKCTGRYEKQRIYWLALWETGAREGELQGIKDKRTGEWVLPPVTRQDVDLENNTILIWNSKTKPGKPKTQRLCYLSNNLRDELKANGIEQLQSNERVFPFGDCKKSFATVKEVAGIDKSFREQDLRHCFATNAAAAGIDELFIKKQLGHGSTNNLTQSVYINTRSDYLRMEFAKFDEFSSRERDKLKEKQKSKK